MKAEIAVDHSGALNSTRRATADPAAQAMKALVRQSAEASEFLRTIYWSTRMMAPIGGTRMPSSDSHSMKKAQILPAATTMPMAPRMMAMSRMLLERTRDQPVAAL